MIDSLSPTAQHDYRIKVLERENAELRRQFAALTSDRLTPEDLAANVANLNRLAAEVRELRRDNANLRADVRRITSERDHFRGEIETRPTREELEAAVAQPRWRVAR